GGGGGGGGGAGGGAGAGGGGGGGGGGGRGGRGGGGVGGGGMTAGGSTHGKRRMPRMNWLPRTTLCRASAMAMPMTSFTTIEPTVKAALFHATIRKRPLSRSAP